MSQNSEKNPGANDRKVEHKEIKKNVIFLECY